MSELAYIFLTFSLIYITYIPLTGNTHYSFDSTYFTNLYGMSSPIHSYLFSPPPSPPRRPTDMGTGNLRLHSIKSLLLSDLVPRATLDGSSEIKPRSPRTPTTPRLALNDVPFPSNPSYQLDLEKTPKAFSAPASPTTPVPRRNIEKTILSVPHVAYTTPSTPSPIPMSLPRPLLRLLFLASLVLSSMMLLIFVPSARLPSLREASMSRRLALDSNGRAYYDVHNQVSSWQDARDRDYVPPKIRAPHMMKRVVIPEMALERVAQRTSASVSYVFR